jgi:signal transduction histidine kinase
MSLRQRLNLRYFAIAGVCLLLLAGLAYHEFITEPRVRRELGIPELPPQWGEYSEVFFYALMPLVLGGGWWLMRRTLAPIDALARNVDRVCLGNLREPLPRQFNGDEADRLAEAFNAMTTRLDESFQQIQRFTLHASHELKTPLTAMRLHLETEIKVWGSLAPNQHRLIHVQLDAIERLTRIVDGLTLLTKVDAGMVKLACAPLQLDELVRESCEDGQALAEARQIRVALTKCEPVTLRGDAQRLRQALLNLTDNAVKYNRRRGLVSVSLRKAGDAAELEITNTGDGIPEELQPHVFERFVRGNDALSNAIDGCGLGLPIVQWIVQAHHGSVRLSSKPGETTTVAIRLPLAMPA